MGISESEARARAVDAALAPLAGVITEAEHDALGTALALYPHGFVLDPERVEDRATCDGLVEAGRLAPVEGVDGGYMLAPSLADELLARPSMN